MYNYVCTLENIDPFSLNWKKKSQHSEEAKKTFLWSFHTPFS